ncbi:MAG TPA: hypothetical protein VMS31_21490 [Pyrinomonadaceae bacterium]|nr:hypothetical protein [Pyrinomonadaceae bacterium]
MRTINKYASTLPVIAVCLLVLGSVAAFSQKSLMMLRTGRPEVKVILSGTVERDNAKIPVEKASIVKSGEILNWTVVSVNEGNAPASQYNTVAKIPAGTQFVGGSAVAEGSASVAYSIDNGKTFSPAPTINERQADGSVKKVAAPLSMYTQVRYEWSDPLNEGQTVKASYKVRLR